jgi:hypothetical protein
VPLRLLFLRSKLEAPERSASCVGSVPTRPLLASSLHANAAKL